MIITQDGRLRLDRERLKQHRKRLGLSQEALAEYCFDRRLCVSIASIKRTESGKTVLYRTARHLAEIYEVEVEELSTEAEEALPSSLVAFFFALPEAC
ncbi:helix-turn-helix domain-containing protein [Billgrantia sp. C5P2]|uniref:helix-turn-helix domain-containing protein n=1 Tax=Billgrantia sp. C5P2 TaxID=3436239 RepID=UPI003DA621F7